jgi:hypothetical protein
MTAVAIALCLSLVLTALILRDLALRIAQSTLLSKSLAAEIRAQLADRDATMLSLITAYGDQHQGLETRVVALEGYVEKVRARDEIEAVRARR